jgi:hypothetical protein
MEACLRQHFFVDDEETASWVLCELPCLCEKPDEGLPICPDFWLVKHYCLTFLLSTLESVLCQSETAAAAAASSSSSSSSTTTTLPPPSTTTKRITTTTTTFSLSNSSIQV